MTLADIQSLIVPTTTIACLCVGFVINSISADGNVKRFIPLIMGCLGVIFTSWGMGWSFDPTIFLTGFVSGLASTGMYEMFKNFINHPMASFETYSRGDIEDIDIDEE